MRITIVLLFFGITQLSFAQSEQGMQQFIREGDSKGLAQFFSSSVELSIMGQEGIYSKKQAELILANFFSENSPIDYLVKHEGGDLKKSKFSIGELKSKSNTFRSHLLYRKVDNTLQIIELRFELED